MCTNFGWLIRVNAEAMLLWSQKHVVKLKSLYSPTSFLTIKVNFDKIQFEDYCIYRPNPLLWLEYILFTSKRLPGFLILHLDNYLCYEENENTGKKDISYTRYEIYPKGSNWQKRIPFWGECMYVSLSKRKIKVGNTVSELNPELWKTGVFPQTL